MLNNAEGGYDDGYRAVKGFWGTDPGSLVAAFLSAHDVSGMRVLDVGAGEGKNSAACAKAGALVDAIECSAVAIENGIDIFSGVPINWINEDATLYLYPANYYDIVICYGLLHCLQDFDNINNLLIKLKKSMKRGGTFILVSFNDGSHDLSAHPGFAPTLLSHEWFSRQFSGWDIKNISNTILVEEHPHNHIKHHHSLTRLSAVKP